MYDHAGRSISYLRLSITDLCNLRCRYCMPAEGVHKRRHEEMLTEDEMVQAVETAASLGIRKVRITGGEPLVKKNLLSLCRRIHAVTGIQEVALTTNATLLAPMAQALREAGVRRVNLSLDTLDPDKYRRITRIGTLREALEGLEAAVRVFDQVKVNTVLLGGINEDEIEALAALTHSHGVDVRFIERMPLPCGETFGQYLSCDAVLKRLPQLEDLHQREGVARLYRLPAAKGRVGLISPVSCNFCSECNRLRLTADGRIRPCLLASAEFPIKGCDRAATEQQFHRAIAAKPIQHGDLSYEDCCHPGRPMNEIGG